MTNAQTQSNFVLTPASPAFWGSAGSILVSIALFVMGGYLFMNGDTPKTMNIAFLVLALVEGLTGFFSLQGKRVAWAFSLSINGTCSVVMLFSAPRIRDAAGVPIWVALLPCLTFGLMVLLQSLRPEEF